MNQYTHRDGRLYRAGLGYEHDTIAGEDVLRFWPDGVFHVDGIRYDWLDGRGVNCVSPLFELRGQNASCSIYPQKISRPPTDEELDHWVRTGRLPR